MLVRTSAIPQYCGQLKRLQNCGLKKSCGTAIADLQNLTSAIPQYCAISDQFTYFLVPFPQLGMFLKINQKNLYNCLFLWKPKTCLKGIIAQDFWPPIFFRESTPYGFLIHTLNLGYHTPLTKFQMPKISSYCPFKTFQKNTWW